MLRPRRRVGLHCARLESANFETSSVVVVDAVFSSPRHSLRSTLVFFHSRVSPFVAASRRELKQIWCRLWIRVS